MVPRNTTILELIPTLIQPDSTNYWYQLAILPTRYSIYQVSNRLVGSTGIASSTNYFVVVVVVVVVVAVVSTITFMVKANQRVRGFTLRGGTPDKPWSQTGVFPSPLPPVHASLFFLRT